MYDMMIGGYMLDAVVAVDGKTQNGHSSNGFGIGLSVVLLLVIADIAEMLQRTEAMILDAEANCAGDCGSFGMPLMSVAVVGLLVDLFGHDVTPSRIDDGQ